MKKEELIRYKAALAALLVAGGILFGIGKFGEKAFSNSSNQGEGFDFTTDENNSYVVLEDSFINNSCIDKCYVVETYNKLTEENEIFIAKKEYDYKTGEVTVPKYHLTDGECYYVDLMRNDAKLFYQDNNYNTSFEFIKETPLYDYVITLDLLQAKYSHEDMQKILEEIKAVYEFESDKELVK